MLLDKTKGVVVLGCGGCEGCEGVTKAPKPSPYSHIKSHFGSPVLNIVFLLSNRIMYTGIQRLIKH